MKVSIITVSFNSEKTIEQTILSVINQNYNNIEYIIIDGLSTDKTMQVVNKYRDKIHYCISEKDNGIYDAMNKGIQKATGEIVGILNSDDVYANSSVIKDVVQHLELSNADCLYGNISFFKENPLLPLRFWKSTNYFKNFFDFGFVPPHPSLFVKKRIYSQIGCYKTTFELASDQEFMIRMLKKYNFSSVYINQCIVNMRVGGASTQGFKSYWKSTLEINNAWKENGYNYPKYLYIVRPILKIHQLLVGFFTNILYRFK